MSRQCYWYSATTVTAPRQIPNHGTSSAFSSSANPDEDWTQISDIAERRRIQNRIAQRKYRKKLKRRLEDLERRAGSSSASPLEIHPHLKQPAKKQQTNNYNTLATLSSSNASRPKLSTRVLPRNRHTIPMHSDEDPLFSTDFDTDGLHTLPLFAYNHSYPPPEESPLYTTTQSYRPTTTLHPTTSSFSEYLTPAPMSLPSMMHFSEGLKFESLSGNDDSLNPFSMGYAAMAGIDIQTSQTFEDSNPHTPPLSHSSEHSTSCSENGFSNYLNTPLSMPPSPTLQC